MVALSCPACGESNSEFDARCAACGEGLPLLSQGAASPLPARPDDPLVGGQIAHFRIVALLGRGGMGVVYRALDLDLGREVALKALAPAAERTARDDERFRREARATAALDHPNIGTVYEAFEHAGRRFIAMAFYAGETLAVRLAREPEGRLPAAEAVSIAGQLVSALGAAHAAGIVHRDVKPENVILLPDGRAKLVDFGLARWAGSPPLTDAGLTVGTAAYLPPEATRGEESSSAGDVWALGVLLYEMLAGRRPFGGKPLGLLHSILHAEPTPLGELRPDVSPDLARLVARCLAKAPRDRPEAGEILSALAAAGLGTVSDGGRVRRRWAVAAAAALAIGGLVYGLVRPPRPPVYVAVAEPRVTGAESAAEGALIGANIQAAILRALAALDGIAGLDPAQARGVSGSTVEIARAVAASEVIRAEAQCAADTCQVRLHRLDGTDGRVLWMAAQELPPSRPRLFAEAIAASIRQGFPERRARFATGALAIDEADFSRYLLLRQGLAEGRDLDRMLADAGELRQRAPGLLEIYALEASLARRRFSETGERHYLDHGVRVARQAQELAPEDPRPLVNLFELELHAGNLDRAQKALDSLATIDPAAALIRRGQLAERRGRPAEAIEWMTAAVRVQPSWRALLVLANAEYRVGRLAEARRHLAELLVRSPGNVEGLRTLAQIELLNDPPRAAELFAELVRRRPEAGSLSNLGVAFLLLRRYPEAESSFRRALELQPGDPSASLNLADGLTLLGRDAEARALYRGLLAAPAPAVTLGNWPLLSIRAQARAHLGESAAAIEAIEQALGLTPDNAQLAFEAAVVYLLIGDRGSALLHARRAAALGLDPRWFEFTWFDPLRDDPAFPARGRN